MSVTPEPGLVIRYDFLWKDEARAGREEGSKDRPCAVVLAARPKDGQREVVVCPITHAPPRAEETAVEIPKLQFLAHRTAPRPVRKAPAGCR